MIFLNTIFIIFSIVAYANFFNIKFNFKINQTYLFVCSFFTLISFIFFNFQVINKIQVISFIFYFLIISSTFLFIYLIVNFSKVNIIINIEFLLFLFIFFFLSLDRYYLDQDEINYWGSLAKLFYLNNNLFTFVTHHPPGLSLWQYLFTQFEFHEGITIFANNVLLISGFFFLFYDAKLKYFDKFLLFVLYYLLLNNLSFGLVSIYSDPILALYFACYLKTLLVVVLKNNGEDKLKNFLLLLILILFTLLIKRSSVMYIAYGLIPAFIIIIKNYNHKFMITGFLIFTCFLFYFLILPNFLHGNYDIEDLISNLKIFFNFTSIEKLNELFLSPIYFSHFGVSINYIISTILSDQFKILEFQIPLYAYIVFLIPFFFFQFNEKLTLIISTIVILIIHSSIILILKSQIEDLHILALPRYLSILILGFYFYYISLLIGKKTSIFQNKLIVFLIIIFFIVTPKKTFGLFVPDNIYYSNETNLKYKNNRLNIKELDTIKNNFNFFIIVHKNKLSDHTNENVSGIHTFYHDIIKFELYPSNQFVFVEIENFENKYVSLLNKFKTKSLVIFLDVPKKDIKEKYLIYNHKIFNTY